MCFGLFFAGAGRFKPTLVAAQNAVAWDPLTAQKPSVPLAPGGQQDGVLSLRRDRQNPDILAVLLIGHPPVLRPVVPEQHMAEILKSGQASHAEVR
ncbi:MAG: hypothetical protein EBQ82_07700 [Betaproteobacteria bacterium]|nr:hypothetical protein [Betaproteobacteria bacterium]NBY05258.1 hypothetical protein [Betaproteobacteria bacterium]